MNWLFPALFTTLTGSLILVFTYMNLYLQERRKYLALWLASWFLYSARSVFEILLALKGNQPMLAVPSQLSQVWSAVFLPLVPVVQGKGVKKTPRGTSAGAERRDSSLYSDGRPT